MKKNNLLSLLLCALFLSSCSVDDGTYTDPITMYEKVSGTWNLSQMKQVDELAVANKQGMTELDLTDDFENFTISLNTEQSNQPSTFTTSGAPAILPTDGYWSLDRSFQNWDGAPVKVQFFSDASRTIKIGEVSITSVPGSVPSMQLTKTRSINGTPFVSYVYTLIPLMNNNE